MSAMSEMYQQQQEEAEQDDSEMMFYYQVEQQHKEAECRASGTTGCATELRLNKE